MCRVKGVPNPKRYASAKDGVADTTSTMRDDKKYLADLEATCQMKANNFASRQQLRSEE